MKQSAELHLHGLFSIFGCLYCTVSTTQPYFLRSSVFAGTSSACLVSFTNDISLRFQKRGRKCSALLARLQANGLWMLLERWSKPGATSLGLAGCRLCHGAARRLRVVAQLCKGGRS